MELPAKAKARLGKGKVNDIKFTPDGKQLAVGTSIGVGFTMQIRVKKLLYLQMLAVITKDLKDHTLICS